MEPSASGTRGTRLHVRRLHHSGPAPLRVLVVGDEAPVAELADRVLDRVWLSTRRGVDVDVLSDLKPVLLAVDRTFEEWHLGRYEAVVLVVDDRLESPLRARTVHRLTGVLRRVLADTADGSRVIVAETSRGNPGGGRWALAPSRVERAVRGLPTARVAFCGEGAHPLAEAVCDQIRAGLAAPAGAARRALPDDEGRPAALQPERVGATADPRLDDLVELARTAFGTAGAEIVYRDGDGRWRTTVCGAEPRSLPGLAALAERAEPTVIPDALRDARMRDSPLVRGPRPVRFCAAHPIESRDGRPIGTLCVYDGEPRTAEEVNLAVLRDLALLAQVEITGVDAPPIDAAPLPSP